MQRNFRLLILAAISIGIILILLPVDIQKSQTQRLSEDVLLRRNYVVRALNEQIQSEDFGKTVNTELEGEWAMGAYAMATYALTNMAMIDHSTARESSQLIAKWIKECLSPEIVSFDDRAWKENPLAEKALAGDIGHIGYYGHLNLMLGCYALLNSDHRFADLHLKISDAIARRMSKYSHHYVETYPHENYPPDNVVAAASLKVADMVYGPRYEKIIAQWLKQTQQMEIGPYGLLPFQIDTHTGKALQVSRGTNAAWDTFFLPLIDENYAYEQFQRLRAMVREGLGFAAVKEYTHGHWFLIDRDSGPVLFGLGATATAFAIAGARWDHDRRLETDLLRTLNLGISVTWRKERHYLLLPLVGDAIVLAMKTACPWRPLWQK